MRIKRCTKHNYQPGVCLDTAFFVYGNNGGFVDLMTPAQQEQQYGRTGIMLGTGRLKDCMKCKLCGHSRELHKHEHSGDCGDEQH